MRLADGPGLRCKERLCVEQFPHERALRSGPPHRLQQRFELRPLVCPRVGFERFRQRQVLQPRRAGEPVSVRRQKRKRPLGIALVFGQMKRHPAQQMPQRIDRTQIGGRPFLKPGRLSGGPLPQLPPQRLQEADGEIFQTAHRRCFRDKLRQFFVGRRRNQPPFREGPFAQVAKHLEKLPGQSPPEGEVRRQLLVHLFGSKRQEPVGAAPREGLFQRPGRRIRNLGLRVRGVLKLQPTGRGDRQAEAHGQKDTKFAAGHARSSVASDRLSFVNFPSAATRAGIWRTSRYWTPPSQTLACCTWPSSEATTWSLPASPAAQPAAQSQLSS